MIELEDPENGEVFVVDTSSDRVRGEFRRRQHAARAERDRLLRSVDVDAIYARTDRPYTKELLRFFRSRQ